MSVLTRGHENQPLSRKTVVSVRKSEVSQIYIIEYIILNVLYSIISTIRMMCLNYICWDRWNPLHFWLGGRQWTSSAWITHKIMNFVAWKILSWGKKTIGFIFLFSLFFFFLFNFQPFCLLLRIKGSGVRIYCVYIHTFLCVMPYPEFQAMSLSASHQIMSIVCLESRQCYM